MVRHTDPCTAGRPDRPHQTAHLASLPMFVVAVSRGVLLKRIQTGSLADQAKLYPGDTIVSVNGKLVNHHAEAVNPALSLSTIMPRR